MTYEDYLQHWGILGMKWGQRNGPPYPLNLAKMNADERRAYKKERYESKTAKVKEKIDYENSKIAYKNSVKELKAKKEELRAKPKKEEPKKEDLDGRSLVKKNYKKLSDKELDKAVDRADKEKKMAVYNSSNVKNGKRFVGAMLALGATTFAVTWISKVSKDLGNAKAETFVKGLLEDSKDDKKKD